MAAPAFPTKLFPRQSPWAWLNSTTAPCSSAHLLEGVAAAVHSLPAEIGYHQVVGPPEEADVLQQGKVRMRDEVRHRIRYCKLEADHNLQWQQNDLFPFYEVTMSLLGLDIGISGCKAVAFDLDGQALAQAYREYLLYQPQPGWMELDPAEVWQAVTEVIGRVTSAVPGDPVRALSVSTHGEFLVVPVDAAGRPLCRFITAIDTM